MIEVDVAGPFGDPDGSRENFNRFIEFEQGRAWGGLAMPKNDLSTRIIVGGKGAGKTLYKRRLEDGARSNQDLYVFRHAMQLPPTELVVAYADLYRGAGCAEQWKHLWRRAIFRSLASLFYSNTENTDGLTPKAMSKQEFFDSFRDLLPKRFTTQESIFTQVTDIICKQQKQNQMSAYLCNAHWDSFETIILENLRQSRPVCYFIDAIDEDFQYAPKQWLDCQKGLFLQILELLRDGEIVNSLHICICIRDIVYSSILETEHALRNLNAGHIRLLSWTNASAKQFLRCKIDALPKPYLMKTVKSQNYDYWLGRSKIKNVARKIEEDVLDYILRHTRYLPRDIIIMGNALCTKIEKAKTLEQDLTDADIRNVVARTAEQIGKEAIRICANHLAVTSFSATELKRTYTLSGVEAVHHDWAYTEIVNMLRKLGRDVFSFDEIRTALTELYDNSDSSSLTTSDEIPAPEEIARNNIVTILWQHGLLGYRTSKSNLHCHFYTPDPENFFIPSNKYRYVLHPSLIDALALRAVGRNPIAV